MSGASEAILEDLLRQANITNIHLANLIKQGAVGARSGGTVDAAKNTGSFTKSLGLASAAVGVLSAGISLVTGVFSTLVSATTGVVSNFYSLAQATAISGTKLSEFYATFKDLPIIGRAFGIFSDVIKYQEDLLERFQMITSSGALFGGSLTAMRAAAERSYMSLDDFVEVVGNNSEVFAAIGNTVDSGVKRFVNIQRRLLDSEYGSMMRGLGYTAKTTGEMLAFMMRTQGLVNKDRMGSDKDIIKRTAEYATHLSVVSQLTGKRAEELQKKVEEISTDASYESFLQKVGTEKSDIFRAVMTEIAATGSEDFAKMFKNYAQGMNAPMGEMQVALMNASQGMAGPLLENIRNAILSGKSLTEVIVMTRKGLGQVGESTGQYIDRLGLVGTALSAIGDPTIKVAQPLQRYSANLGNLNNITAETIEAERAAARARKGEADRLQKAQENIRNFGNSMMMLVSKIIEPITPHLNLFAKAFEGVARTIGEAFVSIVTDPKFIESIDGVVGWFKKSFDTLKNSKTMGDLIVNLGLVLIDGFKGLWNRIEPVWTGIVVPTGKALFMDMLTSLMNAIKGYFGLGTIGIYEKAQATLERLTRKAATPEGLTFLERTVELKGAQQDIAANKEAYDAAIKEQKAASDARWAAIKVSTEEAIAKLRSPAAAQQTPSRAMGSLGMTGKLFENWGAGTDVTLHGKEAVVTPEQMGGIVNNSLASGIETLNMQVAELIRTNKEIADYSRRNVDATRSLSGDLFAT